MVPVCEAVTLALRLDRSAAVLVPIADRDFVEAGWACRDAYPTPSRDRLSPC
jgi:hypothetical protein